MDLLVDVDMEGKVLGVDCAAGGDAVDDLKYISGLSTILVAHIQEVKDRVSQIECIFCSQLFPQFQAKSKLTQARVADAVKANEHEWRKREAGLVSQLEELSIGKRLAEDKLLQLGSSLEETKVNLLDAEGLVARHKAEKKQILERLEEEMRKGEVIRRLEREIEEKAAEVAREREAHQRLLLQVELKDKDLVLEQSKQKGMVADLTKLKTDYKHLKSQYTYLLGKIDRNQGSKSLVGTSMDQKGTESPPSKRKLKEFEHKHQAVFKTRDLKGPTSCTKARLLLQVELKDKDLVLEQSKQKGMVADLTKLKTDYKHLKSQYTYLLGKIDRNQGSKSLVGTSMDQKGTESPPSKRKLKEFEHTDQAVFKTRDLKGPTSCTKAVEHASSVRSPFSNSRIALPSRPTNSLSKNDASGSKQESNVGLPILHWRETRARKESGAVDPHDDFLNTPLEEVKNMIRNPTTPEEAHALTASRPQDLEFNNSDDETQDINIATQRLNNMPNMPVPKQQNKISVQPPKKEFKYRESVRKKADRENLKGVECKQCKKFYDAVLPDGRLNGEGVGSTTLRCEHHDGVSRHRYRYAPPLTPEGFWNIGFESEM
ncbi:hypothetical protein PR202_gb27900 [Eleusine coracana subsp. coracana]|uniref:DNA endonuclease activator Ctp1 C-terminal domain-containing protein n=1 Tax=Eleusine coracana subsp. coracana TaxID=191504 RepID=A0AAV5FVG8_ELECO|nr:hypothetical protein PR202_gb27900 [Eleusine coracana subsp. coracana]